jgi:hypothetical protein
LTLSKDEIDWKSDRLRKESDIRNKPEKELALYQKAQLREIRKRIQEYQEIELAHAVKRTLDGTLLQDFEPNQRIEVEVTD